MVVCIDGARLGSKILDEKRLWYSRKWNLLVLPYLRPRLPSSPGGGSTENVGTRKASVCMRVCSVCTDVDSIRKEASWKKRDLRR